MLVDFMTFKKEAAIPMRRGRPPKSPDQRKEVQISVRLTSRVVDALRRSAAASGVPLARELAVRLEASLYENPYQVALFGGPKTHAFTLLLALTLKHLRNRTGHWWHEDRFTFEHAKTGADLLFELFEPPGKLVTPSDLPPALPGQVRRVRVGVPHHETDFGREAAAELFGAVEAYSTEYGRRRRELVELLPEQDRKPYRFDMDLYSKLGAELMPLARRVRRRRSLWSGRRS
jgi:hypothetical protein